MEPYRQTGKRLKTALNKPWHPLINENKQAPKGAFSIVEKYLQKGLAFPGLPCYSSHISSKHKPNRKQIMEKILDNFILAVAMFLLSVIFFKVMFVMLSIPGNTWHNAIVPGIAYTGIMAIFGTIFFHNVTE